MATVVTISSEVEAGRGTLFFSGARVGAKWAVRKGNRLIFVFLVVVMIGTGLSLLFG